MKPWESKFQTFTRKYWSMLLLTPLSFYLMLGAPRVLQFLAGVALLFNEWVYIQLHDLFKRVVADSSEMVKQVGALMDLLTKGMQNGEKKDITVTVEKIADDRQNV